MRTYVSLLFLLLSGWLEGNAQSPLDRHISISFSHQPLEKALYQLMDEADVPLLFNNSVLPQKNVHVRFTEEKVSQILAFLFRNTDIQPEWDGRYIVLVRGKPEGGPPVFTVSGYIESAESGERLAQTTVYSSSADRGVYSNEFGFFSLSLPMGKHQLVVSYLGYRPRQFSLDVRTDTTLEVLLAADLTLKTVTVTASDSSFLRRPLDFSTDELVPAVGEVLPRLGGEMDLMRWVHLLPGIQTGADGIGGIFVRGGDAGHNLVMIDDVPIYNVNHAGGLLSVFNTSTIKSVRLMKGFMPPRYGGRLASVMDVRTRDGNKLNWEGEASIGLLSSNLTLEGPIVKGKSSFLVAGRGSLLNAYLEPGMRQYKKRNGEDGSTEYGFYDLTVKLTHTFSETDKIYFSYYHGKDRFKNYGQRSDLFSLENQEGEVIGFRLKQEYDENLSWGNRAWSFRWNHLMGPRLFLNTTVLYSRMQVDVGYEDQDSLQVLGSSPLFAVNLSAGEFLSSVQDGGVKFDFQWVPNPMHEVRFGGEFRRQVFQPGILRVSEDDLEVPEAPFAIRRTHDVTQSAFYAENRQQFGQKAIVNYGFHIAGFQNGNTAYWSFQPRLALTWLANNHWIFRTSLGKSTQFAHLLSNNSVGLPIDLWVPSTADVTPQRAWQATIGAEWLLSEAWSFSVEGYYKWMDELLSFSEGATFVNDWEKNVTQGEGEAFGVDVMLRKQMGGTQGWLSYSLAWAHRSFERINLGQPYPFTFDRRHDLKLVVIQELGDQWDFGVSWVFGTGLAFSLPLETFEVSFPGVPDGPILGIDYGSKNQFRLPYYHRLDMSVNYQKVDRRGRAHKFQLGVYNAYNRNNPLYYTFNRSLVVQNNAIVERRELVGVRLLPLLPSLSYSLQF